MLVKQLGLLVFSQNELISIVMLLIIVNMGKGFVKKK